MTTRHAVPDDFPRQSRPGAVPGAQPKLLVRERNGRYYAGLTDEEVWERYDACEDLAHQLAAYALKKMSELGLSQDDALQRVDKGVKAKVSRCHWDLAPAEIVWVTKRTAELLSARAGPRGSS